MAFDTSEVKNPPVGVPVVLVVTSAKVKKSAAKKDPKTQEPAGGHTFISLGTRVAEGEGVGASLFHSIWVTHGQDKSKTAAWRNQAVADVISILGWTPESIPTEVGEDTDAMQALPGSAFEAILKLEPAKGDYPESIRIKRILGAVTLKVEDNESNF